MKRQIIFRGKSADTGEWVYGDLITDGKDSPSKDLAFIFPDDADSYDFAHSVRVSLKTVSQFTGLHDKNGKEIYEGDIILVHEARANSPLNWVVVYDEKECALRLRWAIRYKAGESGFYDIKIDPTPHVRFEAIGNIYENPELLK